MKIWNRFLLRFKVAKTLPYKNNTGYFYSEKTLGTDLKEKN